MTSPDARVFGEALGECLARVGQARLSVWGGDGEQGKSRGRGERPMILPDVSRLFSKSWPSKSEYVEVTESKKTLEDGMRG
ncbi:hypothetical protein J6590_031338 [Homalodisca vitripennis]|nr:hypothetical protein J6590_031338 [Homalodisca vitripennis]